ncbi:MAG: AI-2E family transporter [Sphingobium sp.]
MTEKTTLADFTRRILIALLIVGVAALFVKLTYLLLLVFAAVVLAVILRVIAGHLTRLGLSDGLAVAVAVLGIFALFGLLGWMFGGLIAGQFSELRDQLPRAASGMQEQLASWGIDYDLRKLSGSLEQQASGLFSRASGFVVAIGGFIADVAVVITGAIFFAAQPEYYRGGVLRLVPRAAEPITTRLLEDWERGLKQWLKGQLLSSLCVAVLTSAGLFMLGVPSALALAIIAGVLDFIPFAGPVIAAIPAVLLAFSQSPTTALWTVALFLLVQQIQGNVLQPMVQKQSVDLPPVILLFAVIATGILFGPPGVLLAAPMTVAGYILAQHAYIGAVLGREPKRPARK